jgi:alanine racemase
MAHELPPGATGVITIDLDAVHANWRALAALVAPAECAAVVKADAYGLGAAKIVPALARAGCRTFFVATPEEGHAARLLVPEARLFALDGLFPGAAPLLLGADVAPVLSSLAEVEDWAREAARVGRPLPAALQIDSGLNRLGLPESEVQALAAQPALLGALDLRLVMSHLASADDPADPNNEAQRAAFERRRALLPPAPASLAASDGLMLGPDYHFDLVRPGYALYGGQAFRGGATPVSPVVTVRARVLQVRTLETGSSVGYSATWRARRPTRIAVIAAGYADGIARALSAPSGTASAMVVVAGQRAPIVGRVSMDLITVDVTDVAGEIRRGDLATLIGPGLTIEAMGTAAGTIGYEVLTRLGPRFVRQYTGGGRLA